MLPTRARLWERLERAEAEVEGLRAENAEWQATVKWAADAAAAEHAEVERLRATRNAAIARADGADAEVERLRADLERLRDDINTHEYAANEMAHRNAKLKGKVRLLAGWQSPPVSPEAQEAFMLMVDQARAILGDEW